MRHVKLLDFSCRYQHYGSIISYHLCTFVIAIGMGLTLSAFSLAFNSYFTTKRSRAMGLTMVITGLGPIFMPQVTSFLLSFYGIQVLYRNYIVVITSDKRINVFPVRKYNVCALVLTFIAPCTMRLHFPWIMSIVKYSCNCLSIWVGTNVCLFSVAACTIRG